MTLVRERLQKIENNIRLREEGKYNLIPFHYHFPDLSEYIPGLFRGSANLLLSNTGIGKTTLSKFITIFLPFELSKKINIKFKVFYIALEETKDEFIDSLIVQLLYQRKGIKVDKLELNSYRKKPLSKDILQEIYSIEKEVEEVLNYVDIVENVTNPTGIYKYLRAKSEDLGKHHTKEVEFYDADNKRKYIQEVYSHYEQYDPDLFVIVVCDHINLLTQESNLSQHETIGRWSTEYCRKQLNLNWNWIVWNVQQVNQSSDDAFHQKAGRLEVSLSDSAGNKEVSRDQSLVLSLFDPVRYGISKHLGYDIVKLNNYYRSLSILKNRYGQSNISKGLIFDGKSGMFSELPHPSDEKIKKVYEVISKR